MSCKSGCDVNSKNATCAARMSDGHYFCDWRTRCAVNASLYQRVAQAGMTKSSYEARMYLQNNAETLMAENYKWAESTLMPCAPCARPFNDPGTMLPERYVVRCDAVSCTRTEVNPAGLGDGRQYAF